MPLFCKDCCYHRLVPNPESSPGHECVTPILAEQDLVTGKTKLPKTSCYWMRQESDDIYVSKCGPQGHFFLRAPARP